MALTAATWAAIAVWATLLVIAVRSRDLWLFLLSCVALAVAILVSLADR